LTSVLLVLEPPPLEVGLVVVVLGNFLIVVPPVGPVLPVAEVLVELEDLVVTVLEALDVNDELGVGGPEGSEASHYLISADGF